MGTAPAKGEDSPTVKAAVGWIWAQLLVVCQGHGSPRGQGLVPALGMLLSAPFPSQAPLRTGVMVVMWPHGMTMMVMEMMQPKRAHPGEGQTKVWVPGWDCCPLPQPA